MSKTKKYRAFFFERKKPLFNFFEIIIMESFDVDHSIVVDTPDVLDTMSLASVTEYGIINEEDEKKNNQSWNNDEESIVASGFEDNKLLMSFVREQIETMNSNIRCFQAQMLQIFRQFMETSLRREERLEKRYETELNRINKLLEKREDEIKIRDETRRKEEKEIIKLILKKSEIREDDNNITTMSGGSNTSSRERKKRNRNRGSNTKDSLSSWTMNNHHGNNNGINGSSSSGTYGNKKEPYYWKSDWKNIDYDEDGDKNITKKSCDESYDNYNKNSHHTKKEEWKYEKKESIKEETTSSVYSSNNNDKKELLKKQKKEEREPTESNFITTQTISLDASLNYQTHNNNEKKFRNHINFRQQQEESCFQNTNIRKHISNTTSWNSYSIDYYTIPKGLDAPSYLLKDIGVEICLNEKLLLRQKGYAVSQFLQDNLSPQSSRSCRKVFMQQLQAKKILRAKNDIQEILYKSTYGARSKIFFTEDDKQLMFEVLSSEIVQNSIFRGYSS